MKFVKFLEEIKQPNNMEIGKKGSSLVEMFSLGLPVPEAFIITSNAYKYFVEKTQLKVVIFDLLKQTNIEDTDQLEENCKRISILFRETKIPPQLKTEILDSYKKLIKRIGNTETFVAVRNSPTVEDVPGANSLLNIRDDEQLISGVKECWASIFSPKSVFYFREKGLSISNISVAVIVQKQIDSEKAGVAVTIDPTSSDRGKIIIEGSWGQGEAIVRGKVNPDKYFLDKRTGDIIKKKIVRKKEMSVLDKTKGGIINKRVPEKLQKKQCLDEGEIDQIYKISIKLENYYKSPQEFEWSFEDDKLYLLQTRPILSSFKKEEGEDVDTSKKPIIKGIPGSPGVASGTVKIIRDQADLRKIKKGDILVAKIITPNYIPFMKKVVGIVTDEGAQTSHAVIASRELGIPCIVGTEVATKKLADGDVITIDGDDGLVYKGKFRAKTVSKKTNYTKTRTKIYINIGDPDVAEKYSKLNCDGVGLFRAEFMAGSLKKHPRLLMENNNGKEFIDIFSRGIEKVARAFYPRLVVYRSLDLKTNEYANMVGGKKFEPQENNPMIGWRGASRYILEPEFFKLELEALRKVREKGYKNVALMIPFLRTTWELRRIKMILREVGLLEDRTFKLWIMIEVPSSAILIEEFLKEGVDGVSIGSNDLTQLVLGVDRDSTILGKRWFYESDPAVVWCLERVVKTCKKYKVPCSICGEAPNLYPELTRQLVKWGVTSISVNPDSIDRIRRIVSDAEKRGIRRIIKK
ncbi:MAG: phosphoenolpyruvate synthase [Candidatus Aenigmatarchaeota archaeon]